MSDYRAQLRLSEHDEIIKPAVGDAELASISFDNKCANLVIKLVDGGELKLRIEGLRWLSFSTDFWQNVIERIVITEDVAPLIQKAPEEIRIQYQNLQRGRSYVQTTDQVKWVAVQIYPCAGADLICFAEGISVL